MTTAVVASADGQQNTLRATGSGLVKKRYVCELCKIEVGNFKSFRSHTAGKAHRAKLLAAAGAASDGSNAASGVTPVAGHWHADMRQLSVFPMQHTILDPHTMVADLAGAERESWRAYVRARSPGSPELVAIFEHVAVAHPQHLRLKEFFETMEACVLFHARRRLLCLVLTRFALCFAVPPEGTRRRRSTSRDC